MSGEGGDKNRILEMVKGPVCEICFHLEVCSLVKFECTAHKNMNNSVQSQYKKSNLVFWPLKQFFIQEYT